MFERQKVTGPPTPESAALLLGLDLAALDPDAARDVVLGCERLVRAVHAVQAEAMVVCAGPPPVQEPDPDTGMLPLDSDAEWLAVDLGGSRQFQLSRIDTARYLHACLPKTLAAMRVGDWGVYEAGQMVRAAQSLSRPELIDRLEDRIVPRGTRDLARRLRRAVARIDPSAVDEKTRRARAARRLEFFKDRHGDGTGQLAGTAPSSLMALIAAAIDLDARPRLDGDCRTIDMRRLDVLADWARQRLGLPTENHHPEQPTPLDQKTAEAAASALLAYAHHHSPIDPPDSAADMAVPDSHPSTAPATAGDRMAAVDSHSLEGASNDLAAPASHPTPAGSARLHRAKRCTTCGRAGPPRIPIAVTVGLDTLLGLSNEPAELAGWGLLDPDTARELAGDGEWTRWACEPGTGHLLDVGAATYRPGAALARHVRARDRTCRWPNCNQPAIRCDLDHTEPFDSGGPTTRANLCTLCRRHHRIKHETDADYSQSPDGATKWKDPSGRIHTRPAERHHHDTDWFDWTHPDDPPEPGPAPPPEPPLPDECPF